MHIQAYAACTAGYLFQNQAACEKLGQSRIVMLFGLPEAAARAAFGGGIWKKWAQGW